MIHMKKKKPEQAETQERGSKGRWAWWARWGGQEVLELFTAVLLSWT